MYSICSVHIQYNVHVQYTVYDINYIDAAVLDSFVTFWGQEKYTQKAKIDEISATVIGWGLQKDSGTSRTIVEYSQPSRKGHSFQNWISRISRNVQLPLGQDAKEWNFGKDRPEVAEPRQTSASSRLESSCRRSGWKSGVFPVFHLTRWDRQLSRLCGFWKDQTFLSTPYRWIKRVGQPNTLYKSKTASSSF